MSEKKGSYIFGLNKVVGRNLAWVDLNEVVGPNPAWAELSKTVVPNPAWAELSKTVGANPARADLARTVPGLAWADLSTAVPRLAWAHLAKTVPTPAWADLAKTVGTKRREEHRADAPSPTNAVKPQPVSTDEQHYAEVAEVSHELGGVHEEASEPPRTAEKFLSFLISPDRLEEAIGDFEEGYRLMLKRHDIVHARRWYWEQVLKEALSGAFRFAWKIWAGS